MGVGEEEENSGKKQQWSGGGEGALFPLVIELTALLIHLITIKQCLEMQNKWLLWQTFPSLFLLPHALPYICLLLRLA